LKKILLFIFISCFLPVFAFAATYYIDATNGDDSFSGTEKSFTSAQCPENSGVSCGPFEHAPGMEGYAGSAVLQQGDIVVFKKGETWNHILNADVAGVTYTTDDTWFVTSSADNATFDLGNRTTGFNYGLRITANNITVNHLKFTGGKPVPRGDECSDIDPCYAVYPYDTSYLNNGCISIAPSGISTAQGFLHAWFPECIIGINTDDMGGVLTGITIHGCKFIDTCLTGIILRFVEDSIIDGNRYDGPTADKDPNAGNEKDPNGGGNGIFYGAGAKNITIINNEIQHCSGWVAIGGDWPWGNDFTEKFPATPGFVCADSGKTYYYAYEDYATQFPSYITIEHNLVHDHQSNGIAVCGTYITVQYNEIYNQNKINSPNYIKGERSGFGFYVLGSSFLYDSDIRYNLVHDSYAFTYTGRTCGQFNYGWNPCYEGEALYLEVSTWDTNWYGNVVYNNQTSGFHAVKGGDNKIFNNTFYNNATGSGIVHNGLGIYLHPGDSFTNNIVADSKGGANDVAVLVGGLAGDTVPPDHGALGNPWLASNNTDLIFANNIFWFM